VLLQASILTCLGTAAVVAVHMKSLKRQGSQVELAEERVCIPVSTKE
jgi:hypothetical protein